MTWKSCPLLIPLVQPSDTQCDRQVPFFYISKPMQRPVPQFLPSHQSDNMKDEGLMLFLSNNFKLNPKTSVWKINENCFIEEFGRNSEERAASGDNNFVSRTCLSS